MKITDILPLDSMATLMGQHPLSSFIGGLVLFVLIGTIAKKGAIGWAFIVFGVGIVIAVSTDRILYFFAFMLGVLTAFTEIIGKFSDEPTKALNTREALLYLLVNGAISAVTLKIMYVAGWAAVNGSPFDDLKAVFAAGLGSMLVLRSSLFRIKMGTEEVAFGPDQIIKVFFHFMEQAIDRVRATSRIEFVSRIMDNLDFEQVRPYTSTMLKSAQTLSEDDRKNLNQAMQAISEAERDIQLKSYDLGFLLLNKMGEDFLTTLFEEPKPQWFLKAPIDKFTKTRGFLSQLPFIGEKEEEVNYFAYGMTMSPSRLLETLKLDPIYLDNLLIGGPKKCVLNNHRITFNKASPEHPGIGYPNLQWEKDSKIQGICYRLPKSVLDFFSRNELGYRIETVEVKVVDEINSSEQPLISALTFVAKEEGVGLKPTKSELDFLIDAAESNGLSADYIESLSRTETAIESDT